MSVLQRCCATTTVPYPMYAYMSVFSSAMIYLDMQVQIEIDLFSPMFAMSCMFGICYSVRQWRPGTP